MSRTYRRTEQWYWVANGELYKYEELKKLGYNKWWDISRTWKGISRIEKGRDRKVWNKPPKWFKRQHRQEERARVKNAMRLEKWEMIPVFPHRDQWDWT